MDKITLVSKGASLSISDEKLLIEFDRDMNSLSTALWAGGYRSIRSALNQKLTGYYESLQDFPGGSVESYLKICAEEVTESPEKCPSLLTAARVRLYSHKVLSAGGMTIEAVTTGGVEKDSLPRFFPCPLQGRRRAFLSGRNNQHDDHCQRLPSRRCHGKSPDYTDGRKIRCPSGPWDR